MLFIFHSTTQNVCTEVGMYVCMYVPRKLERGRKNSQTDHRNGGIVSVYALLQIIKQTATILQFRNGQAKVLFYIRLAIEKNTTQQKKKIK